MNSFWGKLLVVDLTTQKIETRAIPEKWVELYSGQKGLGTRILMEDFHQGQTRCPLKTVWF